MRQIKITQQITNREAVSLDKYLQEIGKVDLLTPEQEVELARRIKEGDEEALEQLVKANLRFVVSVAKQYQNQGLPLQDLINEGNVGLITAAKRFDETRGFKFISYAVWWIRQSILQALAEQARVVRLPMNRIALINRIKKVQAQLEQSLGRMPTYEEIAAELDISEQEVAKALKQNIRLTSIDSPLDSDGETVLLDVIPNTDAPDPDAALMQESLRIDIEEALKILTPREQEIIRCHYGIGRQPQSLDEIAQKMGLTRERVRQIKEKALQKLKTSEYCKELMKYL